MATARAAAAPSSLVSVERGVGTRGCKGGKKRRFGGLLFFIDVGGFSASSLCRPPSAHLSPQPPSLREAAAQMKDMRRQMESDENLSVLMAGLRGTNMNEDAFAAASTSMRLMEFETADGTLPLRYDPKAIAAYWGARPGAMASRVAQLLSIAGGFLGSLALDALRGKLREHEVQRARELREILTSLGPAYIKLGQALSIRPDILSPAAMTELQALCDKVPSFPTPVAMALVRSELGVEDSEIFSELTPEPVAAASLGQVYCGRLRSTGEKVALKVQRPYVLETVTVDLHLIRTLGLALRDVASVRTDVVALLDEWAYRFFDELDYVKEGENATRFAAQMERELPQIVVPRTYPQFTSRRVLTSAWLEGEKLSKSEADDVSELVNVGVICYLRQLLDTGFFHVRARSAANGCRRRYRYGRCRGSDMSGSAVT